MSDVAFLRGLLAFQSLTEEDAERLLASSRKETFPPDTKILQFGESGDTMYVIVEGEVEVSVPDQKGRATFRVFLDRGCIFGEMALLTGDPRNADVMVHGDRPCVCLVLEKAAVLSLIAEHHDIAQFLTEILDKRLRGADSVQRIGRYQVLSVLGRGGMATVFEAFHPILHQTVAIKLLAHRLVHQPGFSAQFQEEAKLMASLRHPNIVRVYDAAAGYGTYYIVMERLDGDDLDNLVKLQGPMGIGQARRALLAACRALHYAHERGVVHRDVKPANMFREANGHMKLVDFGVAAAGVVSRCNPDLPILGSPEYAAPELLQGQPVDRRADIYSLGITAFHLLTGKLPFPAAPITEAIAAQIGHDLPDPRALRPELPDDLLTFITRATAKDAAERFQTCVEAEKVLLEGLRGDDTGQLRARSVKLFFEKGDEEHADFVCERIREIVDETARVTADMDGADSVSPDE